MKNGRPHLTAHGPRMGASIWPEGYEWAVGLSHDMDNAFRTPLITRTLNGRDLWQELRYRRVAKVHWEQWKAYLHELLYSKRLKINADIDTYFNCYRWMELEDRLGVRSTFYVMTHYLHSPKLQRALKKLDAGGWEIGLHGSMESYRDEDLLRREKAELESVIGKTIVGTRQHYYNLAIPDTWEYQRRCGFRYDTSFGNEDEEGWRDNIFYPFFPHLEGKTQRDFCVVPVNIMDGTLLSYKKIDPEGTIARGIELMDQARQRNACVVLLWHARTFCDVDYPRWAYVYRRLVQYALSRGAWTTTEGEIAFHVLQNPDRFLQARITQNAG